MITKHADKVTRRLLFLLLTAFILANGAGTTASANTDYVPSGDNSEFVPGQVVVKLASNKAFYPDLDTISGAEVVGALRCAPVYVLQYDESSDPLQISQQLMAMRGVRYAHPNYLMDSTHGVQGSYPFPDDPGGGNYYHQGAADMLALDWVHPAATGQGVRIGVIDGGINFDHPLFEAMNFGGYDFVGDDDYACDDPGGPLSGHGTFVAGVLHLVAPGAELVPYRVIDSLGHGDGFTMARAIERAVDDSCRLINLSVVLSDQHWAVHDAIEYAESRGVTVVVAAGNDSTGIDSYPAAERAALAVAAVDLDYVLADFSNYGDYIDVCAPGVDLNSPYLDDLYAWWSGTSFAAPCVTGQLALLAEIYPRMAIHDVAAIISKDCIDLDQYNPGYEDMLGYGVLDTYRALISAGILAIEDDSTVVDTSVTVTLTPDSVSFTVYPGQPLVWIEWVEVESSNAPAVYLAEIIGGTNSTAGFETFTSLRFASGLTNGTMGVTFDMVGINKTGLYIDTVAIRVAGAEHPKLLRTFLNVIDPPFESKVQQDDDPGPGNYPNPFNPSTTIHFSLEKATNVELTVYDVLGRKVACLHSGSLPAGDHEVMWDGTDQGGHQISSGVYFYRLQMGQQVETRKMLLIK